MKLLEFCNVTDQLVRSLLQKTWRSAEFCFQLDRAQLQVLVSSLDLVPCLLLVLEDYPALTCLSAALRVICALCKLCIL